jgi:hypothetical protein
MVKMYRVTNFVHPPATGMHFKLGTRQTFYEVFMIPKPLVKRLFTTMKTVTNPQSSWQTINGKPVSGKP